ncbi:tumor necrosis factor receptor superfamily member 10A-like isoform X2 [Phascolarctos cinereus]|uniref:Tumor necrosis factor receptor superfamily member 10A-like isoform X2 n=1 Tax=Phascolarctos cinereus TaxID=38626 RepID=A0A6P5IZN8_PHACI|nr:tumor necrosis factor receptor superfamily member 10A-like isoform X2 [Phascolarctos cinereus]
MPSAHGESDLASAGQWPRKHPLRYRALTLALALTWIPAPAPVQVMRKPRSGLLSNGYDRAPGSTCASEKEYWHEDRCCLYCPSGTRVFKHCTIPHTLGICRRCPHGEYSLSNGLDTCRQCTRCRADQVMVGPCIGGIDTNCQCKEGYYCEAPDCEMCQRCTERCPEGTQILRGCNATADTLCGAPGSGFTSREDLPTVQGGTPDWIGVLVLLVFLVICVVFWIYKHCRNQQRSLGVDDRRALDESSSSVLIEESNGRASTAPETRNPSLETQSDKFYALKDVTEAVIFSDSGLASSNSFPKLSLEPNSPSPDRWKKQKLLHFPASSSSTLE